MSPSSTYAVTGANGFIAAHLIKHLIAEGHSVVGTVRNAKATGEAVAALGAKVVEVPSLDDSAALEAAFKGTGGIFHMAAVHPEYGFEKTPEGRDGTPKVIAAAKAAGTTRVVLTSSLAAVECGNDK